MSVVGKHLSLRLMIKFHQFCIPVEPKTNLWFQTTFLRRQGNGAERFLISLCLSKHKPFQRCSPLLKHYSSQNLSNTEQNANPHIQDNESQISDGLRSRVKDCEKDFEKDTTDHFKKIAEMLSCSVEEVRALSAKNKFLIHLQPQLLQEKVQLLLSYGVSQSDIKKNIRICYKVSTKLLENRLKLMEEKSLLNNDSVRFLEGENKDFNQAVEYIFKKRQALEGCANISEYIHHRLQCSEDEVRKMLASPPFSRSYTSIKLKTLLDFFLLEAKVNSQFLIQNSFLFTFSVERLRHRLKIMTAAGIKDPMKMKSIWLYPTQKFNNVFRKYIDTS